MDSKFTDKFADLSGDFRLLGVQFENLEAVELEQDNHKIRLTTLERP